MIRGAGQTYSAEGKCSTETRSRLCLSSKKKLQKESKNEKVSVKEGFADFYFYILMTEAYYCHLENHRRPHSKCAEPLHVAY